MRKGGGTLLLRRVLLARLLTLENGVLSLYLHPCGRPIGEVTDDVGQLAHLWQRRSIVSINLHIFFF